MTFLGKDDFLISTHIIIHNFMVTTIYKVVSESNGISLNSEGDENICSVCKIST